MTLLATWPIMRILRLFIAFWAGFEFYRTHDWMFLAFGSLFAMQAIFNVGCCGAAGCAPSSTRSSYDESTQSVDYQEVK